MIRTLSGCFDISTPEADSGATAAMGPLGDPDALFTEDHCCTSLVNYLLVCLS